MPCQSDEAQAVDLQTPAPRLDLAKRQAPGSFVGWTSTAGGWEELSCSPSHTFTEVKPFGTTLPGYAACAVSGNPPATGCTGNTLYVTGISVVCDPGLECATGLVASSVGGEASGDLFYACGGMNDWIAYRTTTTGGAATSTFISSLTITTTASALTTPSPSSTTTSTSSAAIPTVPPASSNSHSVSGGTIAGAVVGAIGGIALLLGLAFLCFRRSRNKPPEAEASTPAQPPPSPGPNAPFTGYYESKPAQVVNTQEPIRPTSIPPAYPGFQVGPNVPVNGMAMHTQGTGVPLQQGYLGQQHVGGYPVQQYPVQQYPVQQGPVATELGANPQFTGMPPELPASGGHTV